MTDRRRPRWTTGAWAGHEQFRCNECSFDTLDRGAMVQHARAAHPRPWEGAEEIDPLEQIQFASPAAEQHARESGMTEADFTGQPTGITGFTLADVRRFATALHSRPEE